MITEADIAHWQRHAPWPTLEQIEQDLVLSRLIIEIANHPSLRDELVFRGGTCLHTVSISARSILSASSALASAAKESMSCRRPAVSMRALRIASDWDNPVEVSRFRAPTASSSSRTETAWATGKTYHQWRYTWLASPGALLR